MDRRYKKRIDRYWDKMRKSAQINIDNLDSSGWFDYWHCHIDWLGKGSKHAENRLSSLVLGYEVLNMAEKFTEAFNGPIQCWWYIHEESYEDAVYLHSQNENGTPYPYDFNGVHWNTLENELLNKVIDLTKHKVGVIKNEYGITYVVTSNA
jgi:hypothetical protein